MSLFRDLEPPRAAANSFMKRRDFLCVSAAAALSLSLASTLRRAGAAQLLPSSDLPFRVVNEFPHDPGAFTQGLIHHGGFLYESTGGWGSSSLRRVELETGRVLQEIKLPDTYFAEGLTLWRDRLIQLTWTSGIAFVYDLKTFERVDSFPYAGEGWGLTHDAEHLIMSDGSNTLQRLDPYTYKVIEHFSVFDRRTPVPWLNELEYVGGQLWANIFGQDRIARIDPLSGDVLSWLDFTGMFETHPAALPSAVMNGIAFDADSGRIFVTGKLWPKMYELKQEPLKEPMK